MDLGLFVHGIVLGFSIAAPVGPIGVLVIRRTLVEGRLMGLATGLGAATADAFYGLIGALGLTAVSALLIGAESWMRLLGGLFLCFIGIRTLVAAPAEEAARAVGATKLRAYLAAVLLTLTNPMTILSFVAIFAGLGVGGAGHGYMAALVIVVGVFFGSALWWLLLSGGVGLLRSKLTPAGLRWVNRISGGVIGGFGLVILGSLLF